MGKLQKRKQKQREIKKSRKALRKEQRKLKKVKKNEFFQRKKNKSQNHVTENTGHEEQTKNEGISISEGQKKKIQKKDNENQKKYKLQMDMQKQRVKLLKKANQQEDKVIRKLEKQLKLNKKKRKTIPKSFTTDGLDYLLEVCEQNNMERATMMDLTLHDSGSELEKDLALIKGDTQTSSTARRPCNIVNNENEDDSVFDKDIASENERESSEEESREMYSEDSDNFGSDILVEQDAEVSSDSEIEWNSKKQVLKGNIKKVHNNVLNVDESDDAIGNLNSKESSNETKIHLVASSEESEYTKRTLVHKRKFEKCKLTGREKSGELEENHDEDNANQYVKVLKNLKTKRKKQKLDSVNVKCKVEEEIVAEETIHNVDVEDESINSVCEEDLDDAGNIVKREGEKYWEDIYGRTRDKQGNVIQANTMKYVPPHIRASSIDESTKKQEQLKRLRRQMKGLLNRLAENNMNSIAVQIEELYMSHSRNNMNESLTDLLFESLVGQVITPERLIMEHVMLVAILHANVGTEVGAHILQAFVKKFHEHQQHEQQVENKELDNILLTLSHLYNFKVFSAVLMFDILEKLAESFREKEVELILLILRSVGFSLRKDDPVALKELILRLQKKAGEAADCRNNTRVKFMLEVLLAIKNNNMGKIPNYDPSHSEHLKKLLKGLLHKGNYVTELKISLDDLLKADERGRWWVVGSAWTGSLPGKLGQQGPDSCTKPQQNVYSQQLLDLARKQRMNTDVRRNIFCILMTADDYLDAFEKLLHLGLKNQQEREVIHVIMNCCLQEKQFNPYYCLLSQKFCDFDRKYQITIQCALWDRFKELENLASFQLTNLAKFLVHLLIEKGLPLSVLKVIHFAEVDQTTVKFLRQVLLGVLLNDSEEAFQQVFQRVAVSSKLHLFREGIRLFIHHFLLRNMRSLPQEDTQMLQLRAKMADKILIAAESKVMF